MSSRPFTVRLFIVSVANSALGFQLSALCWDNGWILGKAAFSLMRKWLQASCEFFSSGWNALGQNYMNISGKYCEDLFCSLKHPTGPVWKWDERCPEAGREHTNECAAVLVDCHWLGFMCQIFISSDSPEKACDKPVSHYASICMHFA